MAHSARYSEARFYQLITIDETLWTYLKTHHPILKTNHGLMKLIHYLYFTVSKLTNERGEWVLPNRLLAAMEGEAAVKRCEQGNYSSKNLLEAVQQFDPDIVIQAANFETLDCKRVLFIGAGNMKDRLKQWAINHHREERRRFLDGKRVNRVNHDPRLKSYWEARMATPLPYHPHQTTRDEMGRLRSYMNSRPASLFRQAQERNKRAIEQWLTEIGSNETREAYYRFVDVTRPTYRGAEWNVRMYAECGQNLPEALRRMVFPEAVTYDLQSAVHAVMADVWMIPEVLDRLSTYDGVNQDIMDHMGIAPLDRAEARKVIKDNATALYFGQKLEYAAYDCAVRLGRLGIPIQQSFGTAPLIEALARTCTRRYRELDGRGYAQGPYGKMSLEGCEIKRFVMWLYQSWELALLSPMVEVAQDRADMHIAFWSHDGCMVLAQDKELVTTQMQSEVHQRATELGLSRIRLVVK